VFLTVSKHNAIPAGNPAGLNFAAASPAAPFSDNQFVCVATIHIPMNGAPSNQRIPVDASALLANLVVLITDSVLSTILDTF
jgi:hypothetical protein